MEKKTSCNNRSQAIRVYAKVNLFLKILGRRQDGFHEIETLMHPVALADELRFERRDDELFALQCGGLGAPQSEENTVCRAWRALRRLRPGEVRGVTVVLRKGIPSRAGLGGASADAAGALLALDRLFDLRMGDKALHEAAAEIGSDVPYFMGQGAATAMGRGEIVRPMATNLRSPVALAISKEGVSTAEAYGLYVPNAEESGGEIAQIEKALAAGDAAEIGRLLFNTFEGLVFPGRNDLALTKQAMLKSGAKGAMMTGSGATVFAIDLPESSGDLEKEIRSFGAEGLIRTRFQATTHEWIANDSSGE